MTRTTISRPLYQYLITESRGICNYCHRTTIDEVHHIIPVEDGGSNDYNNLIALCGSCHSKIHKTRYSPNKLKVAKERWIRECCNVISKIIANAESETDRIRHLFDSFDAVGNIVEFKGFNKRLELLQERGAIFQNLFRVHDHSIIIDVDDTGSAKVKERQRWSSFVPFHKREYHIEGSTSCETSKVAFTATAQRGSQLLDIRINANIDHPTYKTFTVQFSDTIPADQPVTVTIEYCWPNVWNLSNDRYTYDVFGWAERVEYIMRFPSDTRVKAITDLYVDILGSEWNSIGKAELNENYFRWIGTRLPLFSSVIINYTTENV